MKNVGLHTARTDEASDECYTPAYAVKPLLKYLKPNSTIWCPFDAEESEYVRCFRAANHKVIATHSDSGVDFFSYEPEEPYDYIISNPPYSKKDAVLKRLNELHKPFAILLPIHSLQGIKRFDYLVNTQALIFDRRINFFKDKITKEVKKGISFATIYVCKDFLPRDLIFERLRVEDGT